MIQLLYPQIVDFVRLYNYDQYSIRVKCLGLDCNVEFEYECANVNEPTLSQCIAVYDRCDSSGIEQCKDGSDEHGCRRPKGVLVFLIQRGCKDVVEDSQDTIF